jgi:hypothetical protein
VILLSGDNPAVSRSHTSNTREALGLGKSSPEALVQVSPEFARSEKLLDSGPELEMFRIFRGLVFKVSLMESSSNFFIFNGGFEGGVSASLKSWLFCEIILGSKFSRSHSDKDDELVKEGSEGGRERE